MDTMNKNTIIFYHGNCPDGFTAAWAAWKKLGDSADYVPIVWNLIPGQIPEMKGKRVYFLDFTPREEDLSRVVEESDSVMVIDHHKTGEDQIRRMTGSVYDDSHSGAVLAWKYFHPGEKVPELSLYIEDGDTWRWQMSYALEVLSYIFMKGDFDFKLWDEIASDLEDKNRKKEYIEGGKLIVSFRERVIDKIIKDHAILVDFEGYEIYAINASRYFRSEVANKLAKMKPPFAICWSYTKTDISISLRSVEEFDLIPIVSKFGGGGHKSAVNIRLPFGAPLPWKIIKNE